MYCPKHIQGLEITGSTLAQSRLRDVPRMHFRHLYYTRYSTKYKGKTILENPNKHGKSRVLGVFVRV